MNEILQFCLEEKKECYILSASRGHTAKKSIHSPWRTLEVPKTQRIRNHKEKK